MLELEERKGIALFRYKSVDDEMADYEIPCRPMSAASGYEMAPLWKILGSAGLVLVGWVGLQAKNAPKSQVCLPEGAEEVA